MLNLDTHIVLDHVERMLKPRELEIIAADPDWSISAMVLWEIEMLHIRRRIKRGLDDPLIIELMSRVNILPITPAVCMELRNLDFHSDPADELIAATSLAHDLPLVTRDQRIRRSKLVRCL